MREHRFHLPVVVHSFVPENATEIALQATAAFVEKSGDNVNGLKATILDVLRRHYPKCFPSAPTSDRTEMTG